MRCSTYVLYGAVVFAAVRRGIRPTTLGMSLCLVLALILDWVYFSGYRTGYVRSPGLLFGLGIIWFQVRWWPNTACRFASRGWPA